MDSNPALRVNGQRLWESLQSMAEIGATAAGGCKRLALSDLDREGRDRFCGWANGAGCETRVDEMGNIFARRPGRDPALAPILMGSHLDTQPTGGKFDGVYGVLAGLEVVRTLNDAQCDTRGPLEVVVWTNEEGARFAPAMVGSGVWAGVFDRDDVYAQRDLEGVTLGDELDRIGYRGRHPAAASNTRAAFEVHIEQGPVLEDETKQIGVVTGVQGMRWYDLGIEGESCHAGTTPMAPRRDPARTFAGLLAEFFPLAEAAGGPEARVTVGVVRSEPGSRNTVPARVHASVDLRHPDPEKLETLERRLREELVRHCDLRGTRGELERIWDSPAVAFDTGCVDAVRSAAQHLGFSHRDIVSGAGHDSVYVSRVAPTAMVFVPCLGGLSHNEAESATAPDLEAGCNVLLHAVLDRDTG